METIENTGGFALLKEAIDMAKSENGRERQETQAQKKAQNPKKRKYPTVNLLPDEKDFLDKLKALIYLAKKEKKTDHGLVMEALREYAERHLKDVKGFKDMLDSHISS